MRLVQATVTFIVAGFLFFLTIGKDESIYYATYFLWDKMKDVLLLFCILNLMPKEFRWIVKHLLFYCIIRLLWEIISTFTNIGINNQKAVTVLFTILITGVAVLLGKDLILRWKQRQ